MKARQMAVVWGVAAMLAGLAPAEAPRKYDLAKVEGMKGFVGSAEARRILARQGFVVTDRQFKQIFSAYIGNPLPSFVTTDSAWHTYHVLLEEGVRQLENAQAQRLALLARGIRRCAAQAGLAELATYADVALALADGAEGKTVSPKAAAVARALRTGGPPVPAPIGLPLAPARFQAASFYTSSDALARYFAARQWAACVVFRLKSKTETALAVKLSLLIEGDPELRKLHGDLRKPYDTLVGPSEEASVAAYTAAARKVLGPRAAPADVDRRLDEIRAELVRRLPKPTVNDQLLSPDQYTRFAEEIKGFRLLPPRRLPSAVCFQNVVDPKIKGRAMPTGLDFLAACKTLQSPAARRALRAQVGADLAGRIETEGSCVAGEGLHAQALKLLALLQAPLGASAPAPLRTPAWHDKQLWTQLGAWAEQRHTWALQAKLTVHYMGATRQPPGIVSPYPEFFSHLAALSRATAKALAAADTGQVIDPAKTGRDLIAEAAGFRQLIEASRSSERRSPADMEKLQAMAQKAEKFAAFVEQYASVKKRPVRSQQEGMALLAELEQLGKRAAAGRPLRDDDRKTLAMFASPGGEAIPMLAQLADLCDGLSAAAGRCRLGQPATKADIALIESYGQTLGRLHFYGGNAWLTPRDDFPILTPVFVSPAGNRGQVLCAALARPQALYVIASTGGKRHLHRGAVLSYRELVQPVGQPVDDAAWRARVRRGAIPKAPALTRSFLAEMSDDEVIGLLRKGGTYAGLDEMGSRRITRAMIDLLTEGKHPRKEWLVERLCRRLTADDVGDLVRLLSREDLDIDELAMTLAELPWDAHAKDLRALLRSPRPKLADAAAYLLAHKPKTIDAESLLADMDAQPVRTQRLYCYVLAHVAKPSTAVRQRLIALLASKNAGLRWQAAQALGHLPPGDKPTVAALATRLDDANEFVASAAGTALVRLKAAPAAPAMLARLEKGVRPRNITSSETYRDRRAVEDPARRGGLVGLMVLMPRDGALMGDHQALGEVLVKALGQFKYAPARQALTKMLDGNYGSEAIRALAQIDPAGHRTRLLGMLKGENMDIAIERLKGIDPAGHADRVVAALLDRKARPAGRAGLLSNMGLSFGLRMPPKLIPRLAPLLDDQTIVDPTTQPAWRMCDQAAQTMARALGWSSSYGHRPKPAERKALIAKLKAWIKTNRGTAPSVTPRE